ncbi:MAG: recombinase family protein [Pirellulaceae bacterium]
MAKAIAYGRLSHRSSMAHCNPKGEAEGLELQEDNCRRYWQCYLEKEGVAWSCFLPDKAISARNRPFEKRPAGKLILELLEPGDHLIVDKLDRLWRCNEDFVFLCKILEARQITCHICILFGVSVRRGTSMGDFIIRLFVNLAQWESDRTSDRNREIQAHLRAKGRYAGNMPLLGMKRVKGVHTDPDGRKRIKTKALVWDEELRAVMGLIVKMRDEEGLGWHSIWFRLNDRVRQEFDWPPCRDRMGINSLFKVEKLYVREKQYRALGNPNPNLIHLSHSFGSPDTLPMETAS